MIERKSVEVAIAQLNKEIGSGTVNFGDKIGDEFVTQSLKTGITSLDWVLGRGGLPEGKVIELFGEESGGKSFLLLEFLASLQKLGYICGLVDAEQSLDPELATKIGVNIPSLVLSQEQTMESVLAIVEKLILSGVKLIGVDSVASLIPRAEMENDIGDITIALQARVLSQSLRRIVGAASEKGAIVIFINQLRDKPGVMFGNPETTPGGRALKFYSSVRLQVSKITGKESLKKIGDEHFGHSIRVRAVKNRTAPPLRVTELDLYFQEYKGIKVGLDRDLDLVKFLHSRGILESLLEKGTKVEVEDVVSKVRSDEELRKRLLKRVEELYVGSS